MIYPWTGTHHSTNQAHRRATNANALPLKPHSHIQTFCVTLTRHYMHTTWHALAQIDAHENQTNLILTLHYATHSVWTVTVFNITVVWFGTHQQLDVTGAESKLSLTLYCWLSWWIFAEQRLKSWHHQQHCHHDALCSPRYQRCCCCCWAMLSIDDHLLIQEHLLNALSGHSVWQVPDITHVKNC